MKNKRTTFYALFTALALSYSGLFANEKKTTENEAPDIAAAIAVVKAERALKVNIKLADIYRSGWNRSYATCDYYYSETGYILNKGIAEENLKKEEERNKAFIQEAYARLAKVYKNLNSEFNALEWPLMQNQRNELSYKHNDLLAFFHILKSAEDRYKRPGMDLAKMAVVYTDIARTAKSHTAEFNKLFAKLKAKELEMKEIYDDAKLWVDIQFGWDKEEDVKTEDVKKEDVKKEDVKKDDVKTEDVKK
ncbi:MAG: hypothetical protein MJH11_14980 [Lentisphaeria bacterium]|nr:hypothetical protein [Lentisphaeria bacterium]